jgi:hypothetical protein
LGADQEEAGQEELDDPLEADQEEAGPSEVLQEVPGGPLEAGQEEADDPLEVGQEEADRKETVQTVEVQLAFQEAVVRTVAWEWED